MFFGTLIMLDCINRHTSARSGGLGGKATKLGGGSWEGVRAGKKFSKSLNFGLKNFFANFSATPENCAAGAKKSPYLTKKFL